MSEERIAQAPKVSIVIPVFNRRELTEQCLAALQRHTDLSQVEIIIVDNGSTDGTTAWLRGLHEAGTVRALIHEENLGFARASNRGAAAARGEYLLFLNNDTEVTAGWLEPLTWTLDNDPFVGAVGSKLLFADGTVQHAGVAIVLCDTQQGQHLGGQHIAYRKDPASPAADKPLILRCLTAACLLVRSQAFFDVVGFDEGYWNGNEDVDLCLKLDTAGWRHVYRPESVVWHYESQSGPERWTRVTENTERLTKRWRDRTEPDYYIAANDMAQPAPNFRVRTYAPPRYRLAPPAGDKPLASVIVLTYNALEYTQRCVASLLEHTDPRHELIFVDNASTDGTVEWLQELTTRESRCQAVFSQENLGFAAGNNLGLARARGEHLVLLNSDTVVTEGWLDRLQAAAAHPQAGVVGPMTNSITGAQKLDAVGYDERTLEGLAAFAKQHARDNAGGDEPALWIVGFCLLIKRELLVRIGGLDERFGRGNYEDTDYCLRTFLAGYQCLIARDCFVHHFGSRSFAAAGVDYRESLERNWEVFKAKWGIPAATGYSERFDLEGIVQRGFDPVLHYDPLPRARDLERIEPGAWDLVRRQAEGERLFHAGRMLDAERIFRHVLDWDSDHVPAANGLACALWGTGRLDAAADLLEDVVARRPGDEDAAWNLAEIRKAQAERVGAPEPVAVG